MSDNKLDGATGVINRLVGATYKQIARVKFDYRGRCNAHLYYLKHQTDSLTSRLVYRCRREGCRHEVPFENVLNRMAACEDCGEVFPVKEVHIYSNLLGKTPEEILAKDIVCGCKRLQTKRTTIEELDWLDESKVEK